MPSTQQASDTYNKQQAATGQMIADLLAQGDALKQGTPGTPGTYVGGTPGYYWDNSPAVNAQYDQISGDFNNLFGQATGIIRGQAPAIQQATNSRVADLAKVLAAANAGAGSRGQQQISDQQNAAAAMGIDAAPQTSRAGGLARQIDLSRAWTANAQTGYQKTMGGIALQRNEAQAGAFDHANQQEQNAIRQARAQALANAQVWVPGSRGHSVGGSSGSKASKKLISAVNKEQKAIISAQKKDAAQRIKDPSIRQSAVQANRRLT